MSKSKEDYKAVLRMAFSKGFFGPEHYSMIMYGPKKGIHLVPARETTPSRPAVRKTRTRKTIR